MYYVLILYSVYCADFNFYRIPRSLKIFPGQIVVTLRSNRLSVMDDVGVGFHSRFRVFTVCGGTNPPPMYRSDMARSPSLPCLDRVTKEGLMYPNPSSGMVHGSEHLRLFEFLGRILGKALYEGITVSRYSPRLSPSLSEGTISTLENPYHNTTLFGSIRW